MSEPTQAQMCRDVAMAMEWKRYGNSEDESWDDPLGGWHKSPPNPFTSAADKDALVAWICEQSNSTFNEDVFLAGISKMYKLRSPFSKTDLTCAIWEVLTADKAVIAEAAWRAIQEKP